MTTYTTAQAATAADVTIDTIRHWARMGAIKATKQARQWAIDAASLLRRIAIGRETATARAARTTKEKVVKYTVENMLAIGGSEWKRGDYHRVYLNDIEELAGIEISRYKTGNVSSASLGGRPVANGRIGAILGTVEKVYFNVNDGKVYVKNNGAKAVEVRYLDGERETVNLVKVIGANVRARLAAL